MDGLTDEEIKDMSMEEVYEELFRIAEECLINLGSIHNDRF